MYFLMQQCKVLASFLFEAFFKKVIINKILFSFLSLSFLFGNKQCTPKRKYSLVLYTKPNSLQCAHLIGELFGASNNFDSNEIDFQECNCEAHYMTCLLRDVKGVPLFDFVEKKKFGYEATPLHGVFNAEELTAVVANLSGIEPSKKDINVIYGTDQTLSKHVRTGKCVISGNINGFYGSNLRRIVNSFSAAKNVVAFSKNKSLYSIKREDDKPFAKVHYYDRYSVLNLSNPVDKNVENIKTLCFGIFVNEEKEYIEALINGDKSFATSVFNDKTVDDSMVKFAQQMHKLNYDQILLNIKKLQNSILENTFSEQVSKRLTKRIHILYCLIKYIVKP